jgi:hypothetical protein
MAARSRLLKPRAFLIEPHALAKADRLLDPAEKSGNEKQPEAAFRALFKTPAPFQC